MERHICETEGCLNWNLPNEPHCVTHRTIDDAKLAEGTTKNTVDDTTFQDLARDLIYCPACGYCKDQALVVCWDCFKYRKDIVPWKYFDGDFADWLRTIPRTKDVEVAQGYLLAKLY